MSTAFECGDELRRAIELSIGRVRATEQTQYVAARFAAGPDDLLDRFVASDEHDAFYWEEPDPGLAIAALGRVAVLGTAGRDRFAQTALGSRGSPGSSRRSPRKRWRTC